MSQHPIGLLGGTFDPVHNGHTGLARHLIDAGHLRHIIFLPAAVPPHKRDRRISPGRHRLAMLQLATAADPDTSVSDYELSRGGVCYTVDTAAHFRRELGDDLYLILGMDSLRDLHKWHAARTIVEENNFRIYRRPGYPAVDRQALAKSFGGANADRLLASVVDAPEYDISATEIRQAVREDKAVDALLHPAVARYILVHHLYQ